MLLSSRFVPWNGPVTVLVIVWGAVDLLIQQTHDLIFVKSIEVGRLTAHQTIVVIDPPQAIQYVLVVVFRFIPWQLLCEHAVLFFTVVITGVQLWELSHITRISQHVRIGRIFFEFLFRFFAFEKALGVVLIPLVEQGRVAIVQNLF